MKNIKVKLKNYSAELISGDARKKKLVNRVSIVDKTNKTEIVLSLREAKALLSDIIQELSRDNTDASINTNISI